MLNSTLLPYTPVVTMVAELALAILSVVRVVLTVTGVVTDGSTVPVSGKRVMATVEVVSVEVRASDEIKD